MCNIKEQPTTEKITSIGALQLLSDGKIIKAVVPHEATYWLVMHEGKIHLSRHQPNKTTLRTKQNWGTCNYDYNRSLNWEFTVFTPEAKKYSFAEAVLKMKDGTHMAIDGEAVCLRGNDFRWVRSNNILSMTLDRVNGDWIEASDI